MHSIKIPQVWVASKTDGWEIANITVDNGNYCFEVQTKDGQRRTVTKQENSRADVTHFKDLDDLCAMNYLHEAPLLDTLRRRFQKNKIYTNAGDILISVNPYQLIPSLYDRVHEYLDLPEDGAIDSEASPPHVYKIANAALFELLRGKKYSYETVADVKPSALDQAHINQSIVVSGESGSGKTEASKYVMNFLLNADFDIQTINEHDNQEEREKKIAQKGLLGATIRNVLWKSNVIFEAFGNAKTVRNDNSSRFGKYIKLQYSNSNKIVSAYTETFLLEKSRLMNLGAGERNYHIFYQLLHGIKDQALRKKLHIERPAKEFKMLIDGNGDVLSSDQDDLYEELVEAMLALGVSHAELNELWTILATILHMGNFHCNLTGADIKASSGELPIEEDNTFASNLVVDHVNIHSPTMPINELTDLLGISLETFMSRVSTQRVQASTRRSVSIKKLNDQEVLNNIAALIKWMYSCLFSWLLKKINFAHCSASEHSLVADKFIGILDIFGFEILQTNSFEQLCINYTNERLQQQFNEYVFDREQAIYRAEGLDWTSIQYKDNQQVIDLIGKKPIGLLIMLEAQGMLNRGGSSDEQALLSSFNSTHDQKTPGYVKSRFGTDGKFVIRHFAGDVTYTIVGILEKNNDSLQEDLMELMICSDNQFIQNAIVAVGLDRPGNPEELGFVDAVNPSKIVASAGNLSTASRPDLSSSSSASASSLPSADQIRKIVKTGRRASLANAEGGKKLATTVTVSFQFRNQLDVLMTTLRATSPHYIKCIKPNSLKVAFTFDGPLVLEQLRYSGALEVVRIRQEGYPISLVFTDYYQQFEILAYKRGWKKATAVDEAQALEYSRILLKENLEERKDYQIGHSKIFMKSDSLEKMHTAVTTFLGKKVRKFQALVRRIQQRRRYVVGRRGMIQFQKWVRMKLQRKKYYILMKEAIDARERERARREAERLRAIEEERARNASRIQALHDAAEAGDIAGVKAILSAHPHDMQAKNPRRNNCSLLHSAALSGSLALVKELNPKAIDLFNKDDVGNSVAHYAVMSYTTGTLELLRYFAVLCSADGVNLVSRDNEEEDEEEDPASAAERQKLLEELESKSIDPEHKVGVASATELKSGWLSKRGESSRWRKRWVVLTTEGLMYFRNNKDRVPRDTLSFATKNDIRIERSAEPTAIDIHINQQSIMKKRDRVSLMAATEQDVQIWMNLLKAAAGVQRKSQISNKSRQILNVTKRALLFQRVNHARENLLHLLASYDPINTVSPSRFSQVHKLTASDVLILSVWLLNNQCSVHAFNGKGLTPLQVATKNGAQELAALLTKHGADPNATMYGAQGKRNSFDLAPSVEFQLLLKKSYENFTSKDATAFQPMPPQIKGFHYLSIEFYQSLIINPSFHAAVEEKNKFSLRVSSFNANNLLLAPPQSTPLHLIKAFERNREYQSWLWLDVFNLPFPLDNIEDKSYIVVEITSKTAATTSEPQVIASGTLILDFDSIDSEVLELPLLVSNTPAVAAGNRASVKRPVSVSTTAPQHQHSALQLELIITRR